MGEKIGNNTPLPVALCGAGCVQACLFSLDQIILNRDDAQITDTSVSLADEIPGECAVVGVFGVNKSAGKIAVVVAALLDPGAGRRIVMCACVNDRILYVVVGQIVAGLTGIKGKLQHLHARISCAGQKLFGSRGDIAQVLRDDPYISEFLLDCAEEIKAGAFDDFAVLGCLVAVRNLVVFRKAVEVVDADHIVELIVALDALDPPVIVVLLELLPVVDGIAPELACRRECIGRAAGDNCRNQIFIKAEDILPRA